MVSILALPFQLEDQKSLLRDLRNHIRGLQSRQTNTVNCQTLRNPWTFGLQRPNFPVHIRVLHRIEYVEQICGETEVCLSLISSSSSSAVVVVNLQKYLILKLGI